MCILCSDRPSYVSRHWMSGSSAGGGSPSAEEVGAPPVGSLATVIDQLTTSWSSDDDARTWSKTQVTYAIPSTAPPSSNNNEATGFRTMTTLMVARAREAFELWDDLIAIDLVETTSATNHDISFAYTSVTKDGGTYASPTLTQGNNGVDTITKQRIWMNSSWGSHDTDADMYYGGYGMQTYVHEIGHTLGLSHGGKYNAAPGVSITYNNNAEYAQDTRKYTVMSYFDADEDGSGVDHFGRRDLDSNGFLDRTYGATPLLDDISAIQAKYGADTTTRTGNTTYGFNSNAGRGVFDFNQNTDPVIAIYDAGGYDTLDVSGFGTNQLIDLGPGTFSDIGSMTDNVAIARNTTIEAAIGGSGNDTMYGNGVGNALTGNSGNDRIFGFDGGDSLNGGFGNDVMDGGNGFDTLRGGFGTDTLYGGADGDSLFGEDGADTLYGGLGFDTLDGGSGDNRLYGEDGGDTLRSGFGKDYLDGGAGFDYASYANSNAGVTVDLALGKVLGGYAQGDTIVGIEGVYGSAYADDLSGGTTASSLYAGGGDDRLRGLGAADILYGEAGNDTLVGGAGADIVFGGDGFDTAAFEGNAGVTVNLTNGAHAGDAAGDLFSSIERFLGSNYEDTLIGATAADDFRGRGGNDALTGNGGSDTLEGGAGSDRIDGGDGNDTASYAGSSAAVYVDLSLGKVLNGDAAGDTLVSIENLEGSAFGDTLGGNDAANTITGLAGDDTLSGGGGADQIGGGAGNDILTGGAGADYMDAGAGVDWAYYSDSTAGVTVDISAGKVAGVGGTAEGDALVDFENILGSSYADKLYGNVVTNVLNGADGIDQLYGREGNDTLIGGAGGDTLDGGADIDTVDYGTSSAGVSVNLSTGAVSGGDAAGDILIGIERVAGSRFVDTLIGTLGIDVLDGRAGADRLEGLGGNDLYTVDDIGDQTVEAADGGEDTVLAAVSYALATGQSIETLRTVLDTGTAAIDLTGNELANELVGNDGANVLNGGGGADRLSGRAGNDTYVVDTAADLVTEAKGGGNDTVGALTSYAVAAGQEIETLRLAAATGSRSLNLTGNEFAQALIGNSGNNILDGGAGADVMTGARGNDIYIVENAGDRVVEAKGGGNDTVGVLVSYALAAGQEVEALRLTAATGSQNLNLTGNEYGQALIGNGGNNVLDGKGGADVMTGARGNDTYIVENGADLVVEAKGGGTDTVGALTSYALAAGQEIEALRLGAATGSQNLNLTGNEYGQTLIGNTGNNVINGGGGADVMAGARGNDTYLVDTLNDRVVEAKGGGSDTVLASASYALAAGQEIEALQLLSATGAAAFNLIGNEFGQRLIGNIGANVLNGGLGLDVLTGGKGADTFVFATTLGAGNVDRITDFATEDAIRLSKSVFAALAPGPLAQTAFKSLDAGAADTNDRILYKQSSGELFYDTDGSGSRAAVKFAVLDNKAALTAADFFVV